MTLSEFLSKLVTANVQVSICDLDTGSEIINMKASGYTSLDDSIEAREVKQWSITTPTSIKVVVTEVADTPEDEP